MPNPLRPLSAENEPTLPPRLSKIFWQAFDEVLGQPQWAAIANRTPDGLAQAAPQTLSFRGLASIHQELEQIYGPAAGRGLALRAGRASFYYALREFGAELGLENPSFRLRPVAQKIDGAFQVLQDTINASLPETLHWRLTTQAFLLEIHACPICWNRQGDEPLCHWTLGLLQEALYWLSSGRHYLVQETACRATGAAACCFSIPRQPFE